MGGKEQRLAAAAVVVVACSRAAPFTEPKTKKPFKTYTHGKKEVHTSK